VKVKCVILRMIERKPFWYRLVRVYWNAGNKRWERLEKYNKHAVQSWINCIISVQLQL